MYKIISYAINLVSLFFIVFPKKYDVLLLQKFRNHKNENFTLLEEALSDYDVKYRYSPGNNLGHFLRDLYYIQVSNTIILDSYSLALSNVRRNKKKHVIQIWHALGAIKKFGYQSLDTSNGRSSAMAYGLRMHHNYSFVVSPGSETTPIFKEAFKSDVKELVLPVVNALQKQEESDIKKVLYVPTYRKNSVEGYQRLVKELSSKYELVYQPHPLERRKVTALGINFYRGTTRQAISECDVVITDYSATCFDAYLMGKKVLFYLWDYESYRKERGINMNFETMTNVCYENDDVNQKLESLDDTELSSYLDAKEELVDYLKDYLEHH